MANQPQKPNGTVPASQAWASPSPGGEILGVENENAAATDTLLLDRRCVAGSTQLDGDGSAVDAELKLGILKGRRAHHSRVVGEPITLGRHADKVAVEVTVAVLVVHQAQCVLARRKVSEYQLQNVAGADLDATTLDRLAFAVPSVVGVHQRSAEGAASVADAVDGEG